MEIGIKGNSTFTVKEDMLAVHVGSGEVRVLATPCLVTAIEKTASESVKPYLEEDRTTVGTRVNITHSAATPCGMKFFVETELAAVSENGKILTFMVSVRDEAGIISEGTHERAIVRKQRFEEKAAAKLQN
ncbi:MAG: thioesterase [Lachnospiraceae bacterium]|jgi:predicted thioesterase|nr:thioesterase [Lachnospiraceae bacterium]MCI1327880.1 thioesterase [Lachnospiraceae bacterium]